MICQICNENKKTQCSHDIPKYIGGTDKDGRHNLCIPCHQNYEKKILKKLLKFIGKEFDESFGWRGIMSHQINLKKLEEFHKDFRKIAEQIKKKVFY